MDVDAGDGILHRGAAGDAADVSGRGGGAGEQQQLHAH